MEYLPRIYDQILRDRLEEMGAVLIEGAKWCGKTTTGEQCAKSMLYLSDPSAAQQYAALADIDPRQFLRGETPRLVDEWQLFPEIWDIVRFEVHHRDGLGHFILTGSAVPASAEKIHHTGTGRFAWIRMRPMSLFESKESTGQVSLNKLFSQPEKIQGENPHNLEDIAYLTCRGGWPRALKMSKKKALSLAYHYVDAVVKSDVSRVQNVTRNSEKVRLLLRSYARHIGTQVSVAQIAKDTFKDDVSVGATTIREYLDALEKIFVIEESEAWNPNLRSKTAVRTSNTRYFTDPSIAAAALKIGPQDLMNDLETFGFMFESLCVRDLRVYADALDGTVYHYRDKSGLECDAVIHLWNGEYGLVEIKLGGQKLIEEGAANLLKLAERLDTSSMKSPAFLMVLTAAGMYAYRRKDGVYVVPIGCLKN